jgi:hypothetical protein
VCPRGVKSLLRCLQSDYIAEVLGRRPRPLAARPPHAVMVARERHALGGQDGARCEFEVVLATPAFSCPADALLEVTHAEILSNYPRWWSCASATPWGPALAERGMRVF